VSSRSTGEDPVDRVRDRDADAEPVLRFDDEMRRVGVDTVQQFDEFDTPPVAPDQVAASAPRLTREFDEVELGDRVGEVDIDVPTDRYCPESVGDAVLGCRPLSGFGGRNSPVGRRHG